MIILLINFRELEKEGKTVVYFESESEDIEPDTPFEFEWKYWSNKDNVAVWRSIVTIEQSKKFDEWLAKQW